MLRRRRDESRHLVHQAAKILHSDQAGSERLYRDALALDSSVHQAWFDLGLIYKWRRAWPNALACNQRAVEIVGDDKPEEPAWWNLGIAATALREWDVARQAWRGYGINLPDGEGPIEANLGMAPVRLNPSGDAEVVWGRRIDPARIRLTNIPYPWSGHTWGDIVLHDGDTHGSRTWEGHEYHVFNELERWDTSGITTHQVRVEVTGRDDLDQLEASAYQAGVTVEDWSTNVRILCKACSEGSPAEEHDHSAVEGGSERWLGVAGDRAEATAVFEAWASGGRERSYQFED